MKKILLAVAFIGLAYAGMAQNNPSLKAAPSSSATLVPAQISNDAVSVPAPTNMELSDAAVDVSKSTDSKKECATATTTDKKQCGTKSKGKSCCSKKSASVK